MRLIFMPFPKWDAMYDSLPKELVRPFIVGGNLLACDMLDLVGNWARLVRGLEAQIGIVENRMLHENFHPEEPSELGTGRIATAMAQELIDEGKAIPVRRADGPENIYMRRPAYPVAPTDMTPRGERSYQDESESLARKPKRKRRNPLQPKPPKKGKKRKAKR